MPAATIAAMLQNLSTEPMPPSGTEGHEKQSCIWHGAVKRPDRGVYLQTLIVSFSRITPLSMEKGKNATEVATESFKTLYPASLNWAPLELPGADQAVTKTVESIYESSVGLQYRNVIVELKYTDNSVTVTTVTQRGQELAKQVLPALAGPN